MIAIHLWVMDIIAIELAFLNYSGASILEKYQYKS